MLIQGEDADFRALMDKITRDRGFQCSSYKDKCLRRRIAVRMRAKSALTHAEYAEALDADPLEYDRLMRSLTINVTKFFRNWDTFAALEQKVIPALWERGESELRVWSAGCASGEEPYSVSILMHKHAAATNHGSPAQAVSIVGTDIDTYCLGEAERAFYGEAALGDTPAGLRERAFPAVAGMFTMRPEVKEPVTFQRSDCSLRTRRSRTSTSIVCRQRRHILREGSAGRPLCGIPSRARAGGYLVLGKVETLLGAARASFRP